MKSDFNIEDHLKQSVDGFEVQPRIGSFDAVMDKLARKKRRRIFLMLCFGLGMLFLGSMPFILSKDESSTVTEKAVITPQDQSLQPESKSPTSASPSGKEIASMHKAKESTSSLPVATSSASSGTPRTSLQNKMPKNERVYKGNTGTGNTISDNIHETASTASATVSEPPAVEATQLSVDVKETADSTHVTDTVAMIRDTTSTRALGNSNTIKPDSQATVKKNRRFMIGIHANPQYGSVWIRENKNRDAYYDTAYPARFAESYVKNRKEKNSFNVNYAIGIKLGYQLNTQWEVWINGGLQHIVYYEDLYTNYPGLTSNVNGFATTAGNNARETQKGYKNEFYYRTLGLNLSRTYTPNPFLMLKLDLGLTANNLFLSRTSFFPLPNTYFGDYKSTESQISLWTYNISLKLGVAKAITKRIHYRVSPGLYLSPASMFNKNYIIHQNSYGLELEGALIFSVF